MSFPLLVLMIAFLPLWTFLPKIHAAIRTESQEDARVADAAEAFCVDFEWLRKDEVFLAKLREGCSLMNPAALTLLKAQALRIVAHEEILLERISLKVFQLRNKGFIEFKRPLRSAQPICSVPGPLKWPLYPNFLVEHETARGGFRIVKEEALSIAQWHYFKTKMEPL
jgi:hypothetical protein